MSEGHSDSLKPDGRGRYALHLEREERFSAVQDNDSQWPLWVELRLPQCRLSATLIFCEINCDQLPECIQCRIYATRNALDRQELPAMGRPISVSFGERVTGTD